MTESSESGELVFTGGAQESRPAVLPLPEESTQRVTGEEEERSVFSGDWLFAAPQSRLLCHYMCVSCCCP